MPYPVSYVKASADFKYFLFHFKQNRFYLLAALTVTIIQFSIFKYIYPFPSFIAGDSYNYLNAAYKNYSINIYPIGYSGFLRLVSVFTTSHLFLTALQYLLLQTSATLFTFTLLYFYKPARWIKGLMVTFAICNPVMLFLANTILSDALFITLSLVWFTLLIWMLHRPSFRLAAGLCVILWLAFCVRYNALCYPFLSAIVIFLSPQTWKAKLLGALITFSLITVFYLYNISEYRRVTRTKIFCPFIGWQFANNALYAYRYIDSADRKKVPAKLQGLDNMVRNYFDTSRNVKTHPMEGLEASTAYMWTRSAPLQQYMVHHYPFDTTIADLDVRQLKSWAKAAPILGEYGSWLIRHYPLSFARHYLWINLHKYFTPPTEYLSLYNKGLPYIEPIEQSWFDLKSNKVNTRSRDIHAGSLDFYPIFCAMINALFLYLLCTYFLLKKKKRATLSGLLILTATFWLTNFAFSVFASPISLRFQVFPLFISFNTLLLIMESILFSMGDRGDRPRTAASNDPIYWQPSGY